MKAASDLLNTIVNSLSMIDRGFTVTLTVQPHNWDGDEDYDEEEEELPEIPDIADETIANIKEFSKTIDGVFAEQLKEKVFNSAVEAAKRFDPESETLKDILGKIEADSKEFFKDIDKMVGKEDPSWPKVGDNVWYKTKKRNYACGHVKVVCHNTIQLENLVTLERKDCLASPFEVGEQVWFLSTGKPECGIVEALNADNAKLHVKSSIMLVPYTCLFDSLDDLLDYLRASVYE